MVLHYSGIRVNLPILHFLIYGSHLLLRLVALESMLRPPSHFTMLLKPFDQPSKNITIYMYMVCWVVKRRFLKWVLLTFVYRCFSEHVSTSIVELSIIDFRSLSFPQVVVFLPFCRCDTLWRGFFLVLVTRYVIVPV